MLNDNAINALENKLNQLDEVNTSLINVNKGISYPFVYVEGITRLEINAFKQFFLENPGDIPIMVKMEKGFAKLGTSSINLKLYLELSKYSTRKIYIKKDKETVIEFESILPHLFLERV